ncbi:MAG: hypothetical protein GYA46_00665 [candidate division Zixibacteria bacterium]|nr:hypothetical protein [candidate division Zixibacteria bacterium]
MSTSTSPILPILTAIIGVLGTAFVRRILERRPKLTAYVSGSAPFNLPDNLSIIFYTVVINNIGKLKANNVHVCHERLPKLFQVIPPSIEYSVKDLPNGGKDVFFNALVPGEQVTIAYMESAGFVDIPFEIKFDDGYA